jgi:transposase InsO family protein
VAKSKYASYDPWIKAAIAATGKVDLFPHLEIPRMTAQYWIDQRFSIDDPILDSMIEVMSDLQIERDKTQLELLESRSVTKLLKDVVEILGYKLRWKHISDALMRDKILDAMEIAMSDARRECCLEILDLSLSRYKRWRRERRGCGLPEVKICPKGARLNQLTFEEIQVMREFVTSKEYAHFPIRSLHFFAKRNGSLYCTYSTWRKYIDQYGWKRPRKKRMKKIEREGIRAKSPNEIWHLDVSYFILPSGKKCFIQAIIDNYSRYVLAWQVLESYDGSKTAALLENALTRSRFPAKGETLRLIVDGGGENKGKSVEKLESSGHFKKQVARFEISFSNSMVEALFRSLKHNYLYSQSIQDLKALTRHTNFWFSEHNDRIPHTAFNGETPLEKFTQSWNEEEEIRILVRHEDAKKLRIKNNQKIFCKMCDVA